MLRAAARIGMIVGAGLLVAPPGSARAGTAQFYKVTDVDDGVSWSSGDGDTVSLSAGASVTSDGSIAIPAGKHATLRFAGGASKDGLVVMTVRCGGDAPVSVPLDSPDHVKAACDTAKVVVAPTEATRKKRAGKVGRIQRGAAWVRGSDDTGCFDPTISSLPKAAAHIFGKKQGQTLLADLLTARLLYLGRFEDAAGIAKACKRKGAVKLAEAIAPTAPASAAELRTSLTGCTVVEKLSCLGD